MREKWMKVMQQATSIMDEIIRNAKWVWAKNDENQGRLADLIKGVTDDPKRTQYHNEFMSQDPNKVRKVYKVAETTFELAGFLGLAPAYKRLESRCARMVLRHNAGLGERTGV